MSKLELENVHNVYNSIAKHFDKTRFSHWKSVKDFVNNLDMGTTNADIGCGNGKNMQIRNDLKFIGSDLSEEMVKICNNKGLECYNANVLDLPFTDSKFDNTICIAVIHHLATLENRIKAIMELIRITKIGGKILIHVWAFEHLGNSESDQDQLVKWHLDKRYKGDNKDDNIYYRYYHYFKKGELDDIIKSIGCVDILESVNDNNNYAVTIRKLSHYNPSIKTSTN